MDLIGAAPDPGVAPDVVNRTLDGNDVEAVLGKRDVESGGPGY